MPGSCRSSAAAAVSVVCLLMLRHVQVGLTMPMFRATLMDEILQQTPLSKAGDAQQ